MTKVGQVTISLEPHCFEAIMYAVKDPNKPAPQPVFRPILQYGPPNGAMPPPPTPPTKPATPTTANAPTQALNPTAPPSPAPGPSTNVPPAAGQPQTSNHTPTPVSASASAPHQAPPAPAPQDTARIAPTVASIPSKPVASPRGMEAVLAPNPAPVAPMQKSVNIQQPLVSAAPKPTSTAVAGPSYPAPVPNRSPAPTAGGPTPPQVAARPAHPPARPAPPVATGTDPIIVTLAEKANEDPQLRDLMKRVANGNAPKDELARFQAIIDQITAESKRKGASQGPSADRLFVDGKSVRYFADEVDAIVSIVLRTNPKQTSADLTPPPGSNALVVELVKAALDDRKTMDRVRRIAKNTTEFSDATDLKETLERLKSQVAQQKPQASVTPSRANSITNGHSQSHAPQQPAPSPAPQQALRSKGPPPVVKPDVSAVVFEFAGGNGDRYLFPKFSIVEQTQTANGPQVLASFLIVRKGSTSEYGGDPKLDYYQPVTIRISATQPRHLEYFSRIVAPEDEVKRYMENIMDSMTRAEYVLLAMRLPKPEKEAKEDVPVPEKANKTEESKHATPEVDDRHGSTFKWGLQWKADKNMRQLSAKPTAVNNGPRAVGEEESYQSFIASVSRKETEAKE